jgi:spoIIIJ-associated protein
LSDQTELAVAEPEAEATEAEATEGRSENPLEEEAEIAADYLEELLDIADLDGDIDTFIEGDRAHVSIVSESEALVGPDGEVLDALQELTRLAVMNPFERKIVHDAVAAAGLTSESEGEEPRRHVVVLPV